MTFATEFAKLADLLSEAASAIDCGIDAGFSDEWRQHPTAVSMARVADRCRSKARAMRSLSIASTQPAPQEKKHAS
jgi:hypothetical protein